MSMKNGGPLCEISVNTLRNKKPVINVVNKECEQKANFLSPRKPLRNNRGKCHKFSNENSENDTRNVVSENVSVKSANTPPTFPVDNKENGSQSLCEKETKLIPTKSSETPPSTSNSPNNKESSEFLGNNTALKVSNDEKNSVLQPTLKEQDNLPRSSPDAVVPVASIVPANLPEPQPLVDTTAKWATEDIVASASIAERVSEQRFLQSSSHCLYPENVPSNFSVPAGTLRNVTSSLPGVSVSTSAATIVPSVTSSQQYSSGPTSRPSSVAPLSRRNARERNRVRQVSQGFAILRQHCPQAARRKKISKVETLRCAVDYIKALTRLIEETDEKNTNEQTPQNRNAAQYHYAANERGTAELQARCSNIDLSMAPQVFQSSSELTFQTNGSNPPLLYQQIIVPSSVVGAGLQLSEIPKQVTAGIVLTSDNSMLLNGKQSASDIPTILDPLVFKMPSSEGSSVTQYIRSEDVFLATSGAPTFTSSASVHASGGGVIGAPRQGLPISPEGGPIGGYKLDTSFTLSERQADLSFSPEDRAFFDEDTDQESELMDCFSW